MHTDNLSRWTHDHAFDAGNAPGERGARLVLWITLVAMVVAIVAGFWCNAMALQYEEAMLVAVLGLTVNVVCVMILGKAHHHDSKHPHHDPVH